MSLTAALDGVRVLDLTRLLPGPFLTMAMADLGADVVKIEEPRLGDYLRAMPPYQGGMSGRYLALNRNKRSLAMDLKEAASKAAFLRMCERADVVVESFRPGVMQRLGLGYEVLKSKNRGLVLCSISGFGQTGPYRERAGHDMNYLAITGALAATGVRDGAPVLPGLQIADLAGGALWGLSAILAALLQRGRTGEGTAIDISMAEGVLALMAAEVGHIGAGGSAVTRGQGILNGGVANYAIYATADNRHLAVGALEPKFWESFNRAIGRASSSGEIMGGPAQQQQIFAEVQAILGSQTLAVWLERLAAHDCCVEPILELPEALEHPQHQARGVFFVMTNHEGEPLKQLRTPLGEPVERRPPPRLGEHSHQVLLDYGFSPEEAAAISPAR